MRHLNESLSLLDVLVLETSDGPVEIGLLDAHDKGVELSFILPAGLMHRIVQRRAIDRHVRTHVDQPAVGIPPMQSVRRF